MWIFTNGGFVSIVENKDDTAIVIVRARTRNHLESFILEDLVPRIFVEPFSDYNYRIEMSRGELLACLTKEVERINYVNFKNSVKDAMLKAFYSVVWQSGFTRFYRS